MLPHYGEERWQDGTEQRAWPDTRVGFPEVSTLEYQYLFSFSMRSFDGIAALLALANTMYDKWKTRYLVIWPYSYLLRFNSN